jgi:hypothetical protein
MAQTRRCSRGFHPRKAYTVRRTGTRVAASCVRATTSAGPHATFLSKTRKRMTQRMKGFRVSMRHSTRRCGRGQILRAPYVRILSRTGKRSFVPAACIKDQGAPGKGLSSGKPGIGPLRTGDLDRFGYVNVVSLGKEKRHAALKAAVQEYGSLTVWRKLNAVYVYTKRSSPESSRIFKADRDWINATYGIKAF